MRRSHAIGLLGRGIADSRSPAIHEMEAVELGIALTYRILDFDRLGLSDADLGSTVRHLAGIGYSGVNITHPFKQAVVGYCDELSVEAEGLGAVNTLVFGEDGSIRGENTDWQGFAWTIECHVGAIEGATVAQIGAGGAGAATAFALLKGGLAELRLYDPVPGRAEELRRRLRRLFPDVTAIVTRSLEAAIMHADGVVNASPIGMSSHPGSPVPPSVMRSEQWLVDIIYFPLETELLAASRRNGQSVVNGIPMVVGQAAEAFRLFTGVSPDRNRMLRSLEATIRRELDTVLPHPAPELRR